MEGTKLQLIEMAEPHIDKNGWKIKQGLYRCECGTEKVIRCSNVGPNKTTSCGCGKKARTTTHGMIGSSTYKKWSSMKGRCLHGRGKAVENYMNRGITVCDKWLKFEGFYEDMGVCPAGMELDRIDNDKGYSKDNCQWTTRGLNQRNKRGQKNVSWNKNAGKWIAYGCKDGKHIHLGLHATEEEGRQAYNAFAKLHGYPLR